MEEVRDGLFFGDIFDAADHDSYRRHEIDVAVKLCGVRPVPDYPDSVEAFDHGMPDSDQNSLEEFVDAVNLVLEKVNEGETVFVHCGAGQSRSVCVSAAVHSILDDEDFEYGLQRVRELRDVSPHPRLERNGRETVSSYSGL